MKLICLTFPRFISYERCDWLLQYNRRSDVMNTTLHRVYQTGEGERGSEDAANDLGRLRIRLLRPEPIRISHFRVAVAKRVLMRNHSYGNVLQLQVHFHGNQTHFHMKGFVSGLVLKQRYQVTREWPLLFLDQFGHIINLVSIYHTSE